MNTTFTSTTTASNNTDPLPTNEMDIGNKIVPYQYIFMTGFIRAITREENDDLETSVLRETMKEINKIIKNSVLCINFFSWCCLWL